MTATIHHTSTRPTSPPTFHTYTCPTCSLAERVASADAVRGHRCPRKARVWVMFKREVTS